MSDARVFSAADLKFLLRVPQLRLSNFKSSGTAIVDFASALIPKFA